MYCMYFIILSVQSRASAPFFCLPACNQSETRGMDDWKQSKQISDLKPSNFYKFHVCRLGTFWF